MVNPPDRTHKFSLPWHVWGFVFRDTAHDLVKSNYEMITLSRFLLLSNVHHKHILWQTYPCLHVMYNHFVFLCSIDPCLDSCKLYRPEFGSLVFNNDLFRHFYVALIGEATRQCKYLLYGDTVKSLQRFNSSLPGQNVRHFADDVFKCIFLNENI